MLVVKVSRLPSPVDAGELDGDLTFSAAERQALQYRSHPLNHTQSQKLFPRSEPYPDHRPNCVSRIEPPPSYMIERAES